jgi:hypothetical protein
VSAKATSAASTSGAWHRTRREWTPFRHGPGTSRRLPSPRASTTARPRPGLLPRHDPGQQRRRRLPDGRRPPGFPRAHEKESPRARVGDPSVVPDDEPLPSHRRDAAGEPLSGNAAAERPLRAVVQRVPWSHRTPLRPPLLVQADRERGAAPDDGGVHPRQPRPRRPLRQPLGLALVGRPAEPGSY